MSAAGLVARRNAVGWSFALNAVCFASWAARVPTARETLGISNAALGLLLLTIAAGSLIGLPLTGSLVGRWGTRAVVRGGGLATSAGLCATALGLGAARDPATAMAIVAGGLLVYGIGIAVWDVAMNIEGADVERELGRAIMPRFHAGWSIGAAAGAALGAGVVHAGIAATPHLTLVGVTALAVATWTSSPFGSSPADPSPGPAQGSPGDPEGGASGRGIRTKSAWGEPRMLVIGLLMLALTVTEGAANDWLALALADGYGAPAALGVAGLALFVTAQTLGRWFGIAWIDRLGRVQAVRLTVAGGIAGVCAVVLGGTLPPHSPLAGLLAVVGVALWGLAAALVFPVGLSAAAADPARAAARLSVVSTLAYGAIFTGPPLLGVLADRVGVLPAQLALVPLLILSYLLAPVLAKGD